jgi:hypothetical protein
MHRLFFPVLAIFGLMLAMGSSARADNITFYLTTHECNAPGPCATISNAAAVSVVVTTTTGSAGDWTGATVEFFGPTSPSGNVPGPVDILVNGTATCTTTDGGPACTAGGSGGGNDGGFGGTFSFGTGAGTPATITDTLTATGSNFWTSAATVLKDSTGYGPQYSHGFMAFDNAAGTQFAGYYTSASVPEPTSVLLFGSVVLLVGGVLRRKLVRS